MNNKDIKKIVEEVKTALCIDDNVRILLVPLKTKAASISLRRKILRLNKLLANRIDEKTLRYLVAHELIHLKLGTTHHNSNFYTTLYRFLAISREKKAEYDKKIVLEMFMIANKKVG